MTTKWLEAARRAEAERLVNEKGLLQRENARLRRALERIEAMPGEPGRVAMAALAGAEFSNSPDPASNSTPQEVDRK